MKTIKLLFVLGFLFKPKQWINAQCSLGLKNNKISRRYSGSNDNNEYNNFNTFGLQEYRFLSDLQSLFVSYQKLVLETKRFPNSNGKSKIPRILIS
jgi:hypothetical protein